MLITYKAAYGMASNDMWKRTRVQIYQTALLFFDAEVGLLAWTRAMSYDFTEWP